MNLLRRLWHDRRGAIGASGVVLLYAILVLGAIVGLVSLRNSIVQELGDLAVALRHLDQSFTFTEGTFLHAYTDGETTSLADTAGLPPAGIGFVAPAGTYVPGED